MRGSLDELYEELDRVPEDWSIRIRLVEGAVSQGDVEEARRLVRESPDDYPLPAELQDRIHALLTRAPSEVTMPVEIGQSRTDEAGESEQS